MSNPAKNKKKQIKPISKPYLKGNILSRLVVIRGLKLWAYPLIFMLLNLFIGAAFSFEGIPLLRIPLNLILIILILAFNALVNKLTGASIDSGIGGDSK